MSNRVLYVEDDPILSVSVVQYLELNGFQCDHCDNGRQALALLQINTYDVLITDINMPVVSGYELCSAMRRQGLDTPVIMVSALAELDDKLKGFAEGTDDYLVKPFALKELLARVKALSQRRSSQTRLITIGDLTIDLASHSVSRRGQLIELPPSCWTILEALARAWPEAVSSKNLEHALWGDETPESNTLKVHIHNLRQKIDKPFNEALIKSVPGFGFVIRIDDHG